MKGRALEAAWSFGAGLLFAGGLALSGMTQPFKVAGFLDVAGAWDPSLALVMGGAVAVYFVAARLAARRGAPLLGGRQPPVAVRSIDTRLVAGAALFGLGWGASGFCPGPAIVSVGAGSLAALSFVPAMLAGMLVHHALATARAPVASTSDEARRDGAASDRAPASGVSSCG